MYLIPLEGGEPHRLTRANTSTGYEAHGVFSPDGRRLAYVSCTSVIGHCDVHVLDLSADYVPTAPARRLTEESLWGMRRLAWSRDGTSIIYDTEATPGTLYLSEWWPMRLAPLNG